MIQVRGEQTAVLSADSIVRLELAFKDSIWGGTKLRDVYGKDCDYEKNCRMLGAFNT